MSQNVKSHIGLLGLPVKDRVTGMKGVITSIAFDLYGCIQAIVHPGLDDKKVPMDTMWFDVNRLEILKKTPVMETPDFDFGPVAEGKKGPANKPAMNKS